MNKITLNIPNISCQHCVHTIEMELKEQAGILEVVANAAEKTVEVTYTDPATEDSIIQLLSEINYPVKA